MNYKKLSKEDIYKEFLKLKKENEKFVKTTVNTGFENSNSRKKLIQENNDYAFLASLSYHLADYQNKDIIKDIALPAIKEYTKATYTQFSVYDPKKKALNFQQLDADSPLLKSLVNIAGKKILSTATPVSDKNLRQILSENIKHSDSLNEISFGAIPEQISKAISQVTGICKYIVLAHIYSGTLFGTTLLAFKKEQPLPPDKILQSFANVLAVALRNKITAEDLKRSEANLKAIAENTMESIWSIDTNYKVLYINKVFEKAYEETFGVIMTKGDDVLEALPSPLREIWKERYDRALGNEQFIVTDKIDGPQGIIYIEVAMNPIVIDGRVAGVSVYGKDTSSSRRSEEELLYAIERNKALLNANPDLLFVFDSNYVIQDYHSGGGDHQLYARPEDFLGKKINDMLPEEVSSKAIKNIDYVLKTGKTGYSTYNLSVSGQIRHFESRFVQCGPYEVLSIVRDISKQKEAEQTLRENEANLKAILENSLESIWSIDLDYNIQYVNEVFASSFEQSFGNPLKKGVNVLQALPEPLRDLWKSRYDRAFNNEHFVFTDHIKLENLSIYIEVAINPIVVDGKVVGASFYGRDISESKNTELQLIAAKEKAEESDRLKSAFLANMSHEIRTPMNGILGFSSLLKNPDLEGEKQIEFIEIIQKSGTRMLNIINDLINISKIEAGQMEILLGKINMNDQLKFMYNFFHAETSKKGLEFSMVCPLPDDQTTIISDGEKVYAILTNLIKNAVKFTKKGSVEFGYTMKDQVLQIYVKDTGIGIPDSMKETIFDRFFQADSRLSRGYEGSGLGLSISKAYVEMLGGEIWIESTEGKGSCFYFTLPSRIELKEKPKKEIPVPAIEDNISRKTTILIAEDDETSILYLEALFKGSSYKIIFARNGEEAVLSCRENPDIDLVLMDIKMPVLDGHEAAKMIKFHRPSLPIIAQTAFALETEKKKYSQIFDDYLTKPLEAKTLKQKVNFYLSTN